MSLQDPIVGRYMAQFRAGLRGLPSNDRNEVAQEIESHIAEALAAGRSLTDVLERLGPADRLARAYTADALLGAGTPSLGRWLRAAGVLAGFSLASLVIIPVLGLCGVIFPLAGAWGAIANVVQFFFPEVGYIGGAKLGPITDPGLTLAFGLIADAVVVFLGIGAFRLLKRYIRLLTTRVRGVWS